MTTERIDIFHAPIKNVGGFLEPDIDDSVDYHCELIDGIFVVRVIDAPVEKIDMLKERSIYVKTEVVEKRAEAPVTEERN